MNNSSPQIAPFLVIQSEAKDLVYTHVYVPEILPPFGRLNDKKVI